MVSTELWRILFFCVWRVVFIGLFHQVWPLLLVPRPSSSRGRVRTDRQGQIVVAGHEIMALP